jgi:integrase
MSTKVLTKVGLEAMRQPGRYRDASVTGLYVQVTRGHDGQPRRSFIYRYRAGERTREMGLGGYPAVSLSEAREKARSVLELRAKGLDPLDEAQRAKAEAKAGPTSQTFAQAAQAYLDHLTAQRANTKWPGYSSRNWESSLRRFALPKIGKLDVREIKHSHVASILAPLSLVHEKNKTRGKGGPVVAAQLRSRIERTLDFAAAHGFRDPDTPNPARPELLKVVLGNTPATKHHAAPPLAEAPALFQRIHEAEGSVYRAAEFLILTATRVRETLDAKWDEIDLATATWTIPAARMKMSVAHVVPLSSGAMAVLAKQEAIRQNGFLFPGRFGSPRGSATIAPALKRIGITGITLHGWRSVARDALADVLDVDRETCEFVLAHVAKGVEGAYRRETALAKRRVAMERYASWLAGETAATNVVKFPATA